MTRAEELLAIYWGQPTPSLPVYVARVNGYAVTWSRNRRDAERRAPEGASIARERRAKGAPC